MPEKINQELQSVYLKGINLNERLIREREQVLINQYRVSLKKVQGLIAQMYAKYGDKVTFDQMVQYQRLTGLENNIVKEIQTLTRTSQTAIKNSIQDGHQMSYQHAGFGFETTLQTQLGWGLLNKDQLKAAIYNPLDRIKWDTRNLDNINAMNKGIRQAVTSGLIEGKGYYKTAREVAESMQIGLNKAKRIIRTESHRAQVAGRKAGINRLKKRYAKTDTVIEEFWDATLDGDTRPNHGSMEGIPSDENGKFLFTTMKGTMLLVDGPGLTGTTDDINCVLPKTNVISPKIEKATKRYYEGWLIEITTPFNIITATPNHPILTDKGFVPFNLICKGDNIINCTFEQNISTSDPQPNYSPTTIKKLFGFLKVIGRKERVTGTKPQFHGDGFNADVDIVATKSFLWDWVQTSLFEKVNHKKFSFADLTKGFLFGDSRLSHFAFRSFATLTRLMASSHSVKPLFFAHGSPLNRFGLGLSTSLDSVLQEDSFNSTAINIEAFCNDIFGDSVNVGLSYVTHIRKYYFSGHVYNLETVNDFYLASNILNNNDNFNILHNCRCGLTTQMDGVTPKMRRDNELKKNVPYQTYPEWYEAKYGKAPPIPKTRVPKK